MSLLEILVVLIVAIILLKPEDYTKLLRSMRDIYKYFSAVKSQVKSEIDKITKLDEENEASDAENEEINFYMQKIFDLNKKYTGEYNLADVKAFYHKLLLKKKIGDRK